MKNQNNNNKIKNPKTCEQSKDTEERQEIEHWDMVTRNDLIINCVIASPSVLSLQAVSGLHFSLYSHSYRICTL